MKRFTHALIEKNLILLGVLTLLTVAIGGLVQIVPLFLVETTIERVQGIRESLKGGNIEIIDVRTDESDFARARRNAEDALSRESNLGMMVGLWAYNTPQIYQAVREAGRQGKVKIVGFDEDALTLRGVADGTIHSTVVQQPYEFGYRSMKGLIRVVNGDRGWIPANKQDIVETKVIDKTNVGEFQSYMRQLLRGS